MHVMNCERKLEKLHKKPSLAKQDHASASYKISVITKQMPGEQEKSSHFGNSKHLRVLD